MAHNPGFLKLVNDAKIARPEIDIDGYKKMRDAGEPHILVDTREDSEWDAGHVAGAVHLSKGIIERDIETKVPDKNAKLVLYCGGGFRSALVADSAAEDGLHERDLARRRLEGLAGCRNAGREITRARTTTAGW